MKYLLPLLGLLLIACKGETESRQTDAERIEESARNYFFMGDSIKVECEILDTIFTKELDEILDVTQENLRLVQLDIDTLNSIIDDRVYTNLEERNSLYPESIDQKMALKDLEVAKMKLKMAEFKAKKVEFQNSNRIYMHLSRSTYANISGYSVNVHYELGEEKADLVVLMDADFDVVD